MANQLLSCVLPSTPIAAMNPRNTVFDAKRLIGRHFSDPVVQDDVKHFSFTVAAGAGDKPMIQGELHV